MDDNWGRSAGEICPACGKEAWRFRVGVCFPCAFQLDLKAERDIKRQAVLLQAVKAHNTRVDRMKKKKAPDGAF